MAQWRDFQSDLRIGQPADADQFQPGGGAAMDG
jgi:hypothetical protein